MRWKLLLPMWAKRWIISISQIRNWPLHWYHDLLKGAQAWSHLALWVMIWSPIAWIAFVSAFTHPTLVFRDETSIIPSLFRFSVPINLKFQLWWNDPCQLWIFIDWSCTWDQINAPYISTLFQIFPTLYRPRFLTEQVKVTSLSTPIERLTKRFVKDGCTWIEK